MIWTLTEEGQSRRSVAREVQCSLATVQRVLAEDPAKLESIRAAQREERSRLWQQIEHKGLTQVLAWLEALQRAVFDKNGRVKIKLGTRDVLLLERAPAVLNAVRGAAKSATEKTNLLTGDPTERTEHSGSGLTVGAIRDLSDEDVVRLAVKYDMAARLPAYHAQILARLQAAGDPAVLPPEGAAGA